MYTILELQPPLKVIIKSQQNSITWKRMVVHSSKCTGSNIWLGMKWKANKCLYFLLLNVKAQYCWMLNFEKLQQRIIDPATYSFINIRQVPPSILPTPQVHTFTIIVIGRWTGQGHSPTRQHRQRVYRLVICFDHLMDGQDTHTPLQNMKLSSLRISVAFIYSASSFSPSQSPRNRRRNPPPVERLFMLLAGQITPQSHPICVLFCFRTTHIRRATDVIVVVERGARAWLVLLSGAS